jgi:hypothetical protein
MVAITPVSRMVLSISTFVIVLLLDCVRLSTVVKRLGRLSKGSLSSTEHFRFHQCLDLGLVDDWQVKHQGLLQAGGRSSNKNPFGDPPAPHTLREKTIVEAGVPRISPNRSQSVIGLAAGEGNRVPSASHTSARQVSGGLGNSGRTLTSSCSSISSLGRANC